MPQQVQAWGNASCFSKPCLTMCLRSLANGKLWHAPQCRLIRAWLQQLPGRIPWETTPSNCQSMFKASVKIPNVSLPSLRYMLRHQQLQLWYDYVPSLVQTAHLVLLQNQIHWSDSALHWPIDRPAVHLGIACTWLSCSQPDMSTTPFCCAHRLFWTELIKPGRFVGHKLASRTSRLKVHKLQHWQQDISKRVQSM